MSLKGKPFSKRGLGFFCASVIFYVCLNEFYINIGQDMGPENYLPYVVPVIVLLYLTQHLADTNLISLSFLAHLLPALLWCITFPWLYSLTYNVAWYVSLIRMDFLIGAGLFIFLACLQMTLLQKCKRINAVAALMALLDILAALIPSLEIAYYMIYQHCLTAATLMALYLTNPREGMDFIQTNLGNTGIIAVLAGIVVFFYLFYKINCKLAKRMQKCNFTRTRKRATYILTVFTALYTFLFLLPQASIIGDWKEVISYVEQTQEYSRSYQERYADMQLTSSSTLAQKAPGTVIMVIGESASRTYMKAYTPSIPYDDTPWLDERRNDKDFVVFDNAYSSWVQTVPVLQRALTEQSQYNDKEFYDSLSVIDVAKKAGYDTYWFSNQGRYGEYDSAITLVAKTANHAKWADDSYVFTNKVDETLLNFLPEIDPNKNNFVVLHLMGSHIYYNNRYPASFEKWKSEDKSSAEQSYANSILYTDHVLSQIYDYAKKNLHLQAMVYFSDHGEDVNISHNPDVFKYDMVRIPMFVYMSKQYQQAYPQQTAVLQEHQKQFFTNDMIYDTICGILNAPSNHYDAGQDFSSAQYRFNIDNVTTMLGERKISDDPYLQN